LFDIDFYFFNYHSITTPVPHITVYSHLQLFLCPSDFSCAFNDGLLKVLHPCTNDPIVSMPYSLHTKQVIVYCLSSNLSQSELLKPVILKFTFPVVIFVFLFFYIFFWFGPPFLFVRFWDKSLSKNWTCRHDWVF